MKIYHIFHVPHLEPCKMVDILNKKQILIFIIEIDNNQAKVLNSRQFQNKLKYLIYWHNFDSSKFLWKQLQDSYNCIKKN